MSPIKLTGRGPGRREAPRRIALAIFASLAVLAIAGAVIWVIIRYPNLGITHPAAQTAPSCVYSSHNVTVAVSGPDCNKTMVDIADDTLMVWGSSRNMLGEEFAELKRGPDIVRVYDKGNRPLAGMVADKLSTTGWSPALPTPEPTP
jgi:hypothetical protein